MPLFQFLVLGMPFVSGLLFFRIRTPIAKLVCRRSNIAEEDRAILIDPRLAITTACVIAGLMLALSQVPEFAQLLSKQFLMAAQPDVRGGESRRKPEDRHDSAGHLYGCKYMRPLEGEKH